MEWQKILFGDKEASFLLEIALRTLILFVMTIVIVRLSGKRGVKQLSLFEMVMIISLGTAAGDPMIYEEIGVLQALAAFVVILIVYRIIIYFIGRYEQIEELFEGKPKLIIKEGRLVTEDRKLQEMGIDEFFAELRQKNIEHLGQVKQAVMETNGGLSVLFEDEAHVRPGLPIWPELYDQKDERIPHSGDFACAQCGHVQIFAGNEQGICCANCNSCKEWVQAMETKRIS